MGERRHLLTMDPVDTRSCPLWFGVLGPPLAWAAHLLLSDGVYELGCAPGFSRPEIYGLPLTFWQVLETGLAAAVTILAGALARRAYRQLRNLPEGTSVSRAKAMAIAGMGSSFIYLVLLGYGFLPPLFLHGCTSSL